MKRLLLSIIMTITSFAGMAQQTESQDSLKINTPFSDSLGQVNGTIFLTDVGSAAQAALDNERFLLIYFYTEKSAPCSYFESTVFGNEEVYTYLNNNYVCLALNGEVGAGYNFVSNYEIMYYPAVLIFDLEGKEFGRIDGGVETAEEFMEHIDMMFARYDYLKGREAMLQEAKRLETIRKDYLKRQKQIEKEEKRK